MTRLMAFLIRYDDILQLLSAHPRIVELRRWKSIGNPQASGASGSSSGSSCTAALEALQPGASCTAALEALQPGASCTAALEALQPGASCTAALEALQPEFRAGAIAFGVPSPAATQAANPFAVEASVPAPRGGRRRHSGPRGSGHA